MPCLDVCLDKYNDKLDSGSPPTGEEEIKLTLRDSVSEKLVEVTIASLVASDQLHFMGYVVWDGQRRSCVGRIDMIKWGRPGTLEIGEAQGRSTHNKMTNAVICAWREAAGL